MRFSEILQAMTGSGGEWSASVGEEWLQGRTVFGGLQAAIAVRAMRGLVPAELPLRTLQTSFIAPLGAGSFRAEARVLRSGRSATQVEARLYDGEQVACSVLGIFGSARESQVSVSLPYPAVPKDFDSAREIPFIPGATPVFTRNVRMRWASGTFPFQGSTVPKTQIYVSLRDEPTCDELLLLGLADIIPSPGLSLLKKPAPASSLTWTLELFSQEYDGSAADPFLVDAEVVTAADGYISHSTTVWSPAQRLIALSRQSVVVFG